MNIIIPDRISIVSSNRRIVPSRRDIKTNEVDE